MWFDAWLSLSFQIDIDHNKWTSWSTDCLDRAQRARTIPICPTVVAWSDLGTRPIYACLFMTSGRLMLQSQEFSIMSWLSLSVIKILSLLQSYTCHSGHKKNRTIVPRAEMNTLLQVERALLCPNTRHCVHDSCTTAYIASSMHVSKCKLCFSVADAEAHALLVATHMFDQLQINNCTLLSDNIAVVQAIDATYS